MPHWKNWMLPVADPRGAISPETKIFSISCSFSENLVKLYVGATHGNPGYWHQEVYLTRFYWLSFRRLHHYIEKGRGRNQPVYKMDVTYIRTCLWMIITLIYVVAEVKPSELHEGEPNVCQHTETYVSYFTFNWFLICVPSLIHVPWKKSTLVFNVYSSKKGHCNNLQEIFILKNF